MAKKITDDIPLLSIRADQNGKQVACFAELHITDEVEMLAVAYTLASTLLKHSELYHFTMSYIYDIANGKYDNDNSSEINFDQLLKNLDN